MLTRRRVGVALSTTGAILLAATVAGPAVAADVPADPVTSTLSASALLPWFVAPSLVALRSEADQRWPGRDRSSDGTIGDARHQARSNSHNAVGHAGGPALGSTGAVHALDITTNGIDVQTVLDATIGDRRVWYVIYGGRIWSRTFGWAAQTYSGDPHTTHIHVNLREDSQAAALAAEQDTGRWLGGSARSTGASRGATVSPAVSAKMGTTTTKALQRALMARGFRIPSGPTGWYGPETTRAVAAFQSAQGWSGSAADGLAGAVTLRRLGVTGSGSDGVGSATSASLRKTRASSSAGRAGASAGAYRPGTASRAVYFLQQALIERGYSIPAGPTGYYGTKTVDAVKAFQKAQGWSGGAADGVAGARTLQRLGLA